MASPEPGEHRQPWTSSGGKARTRPTKTRLPLDGFPPFSSALRLQRFGNFSTGSTEPPPPTYPFIVRLRSSGPK